MRLVWAPTAIRHLREAAGTLALFPTAGRATASGHRMLAVPRTPFRLVYRAETDRILITAVWHGARAWPFDPR